MCVMMSPSRSPQSRAGGAAALRAGHLGKAHHHYAVGKEFDAHRAAHGDHRPLLRGPAGAADTNDASTNITATARAAHGLVLDSSFI